MSARTASINSEKKKTIYYRFQNTRLGPLALSLVADEKHHAVPGRPGICFKTLNYLGNATLNVSIFEGVKLDTREKWGKAKGTLRSKRVELEH